jgi:hypothetical protein
VSLSFAIVAVGQHDRIVLNVWGLGACEPTDPLTQFEQILVGDRRGRE